MSFDTIRINELAKELGMTSKEVLEKLESLGIKGKTHSSTVTQEQIKRLKDFMENGAVKAKPKAFVVKKAKVEEKEAAKEAAKEEAKERKEELKKAIEKPVVEKVQRPKIEIVRRSAQKPAVQVVRKADKSDAERPKKFGKDGKFPPKRDGERPAGKDFGAKKPIERRIISQDIYENKSGGKGYGGMCYASQSFTNVEIYQKANKGDARAKITFLGVE